MTQSLSKNPHTTAALGPIVHNTTIRSSVGPFRVLPEYTITYPSAVTAALGELYCEYNRAFAPLVHANREWSTDYQYCLTGSAPCNVAVQIDMVGLDDAFLHGAAHQSPDKLREMLRGKIFEIENSLAWYQLLERIGSQNGEDSFFKKGFRATLADLRRQHGKPIALLAITDQKYQSVITTEFGGEYDDVLSDADVQDLSGFDRFFSPKMLQEHVRENDGRCDYLLYARTSDPVSKLKKPDQFVHQPLLDDPEMRRLIKAHAVTLNVDNPSWSNGDIRRINDTKGYQPLMRMAFPITSDADLRSDAFRSYLQECGATRMAIESDEVPLRCKPFQGAYGCYGHVSGTLTSSHFRGELKRNLRQRGRYVVQPEMSTPTLTNTTDRVTYTFIDRNFFGMIDGVPRFIGGFRCLLPLDSMEAKRGRIHGNAESAIAIITS